MLISNNMTIVHRKNEQPGFNVDANIPLGDGRVTAKKKKGGRICQS